MMKWFHFHQWSPVAVRKAVQRFDDVTLVLYRCKHCTKVKTKTVLGHWTLEQVTNPVTTDLEFFKKLGIKL